MNRNRNYCNSFYHIPFKNKIWDHRQKENRCRFRNHLFSFLKLGNTFMRHSRLSVMISYYFIDVKDIWWSYSPLDWLFFTVKVALKLRASGSFDAVFTAAIFLLICIILRLSVPKFKVFAQLI